jgi:hypothetical protein
MFGVAKVKPITRLNLLSVRLLILLCVVVGVVDLVDPTLLSLYASLGCGVIFMASVLWLLQRIAVAIVNGRSEQVASVPGVEPRGDGEQRASPASAMNA